MMMMMIKLMPAVTISQSCSFYLFSRLLRRVCNEGQGQ